MIRIIVFIIFICLIYADEGDYYAPDDPYPTFFPTDFPTTFVDFIPTDPVIANVTETSSSSKGDWSYQDQITMAAIILLSIPALVGFTLSLALIDRSIIRSQRLPTTSPSAHNSNHEEGDEVIEWELQSNTMKEVKYSDKALQKTTKTFQEWFNTSASPNSKKKETRDFSYSLQTNQEKSDPAVQETVAVPKHTFIQVLRFLSIILSSHFFLF